MVSIHKCTQCGGPVESRCGQTHESGTLHWHRSILCPICGPVLEEDGFDDFGELRNEILQVEGEWCLKLQPGSDRLQALKVVRRLFKLSLEKVKSKLTALTGTRAEMHWVKYHLDREGVASEVSPVKAP